MSGEKIVIDPDIKVLNEFNEAKLVAQGADERNEDYLGHSTIYRKRDLSHRGRGLEQSLVAKGDELDSEISVSDYDGRRKQRVNAEVIKTDVDGMPPKTFNSYKRGSEYSTVLYREGQKRLESDNPLVHRMLANIAIKNAREVSLDSAAEAREREAKKGEVAQAERKAA
jgi:hypothetical protein